MIIIIHASKSFCKTAKQFQPEPVGCLKRYQRLPKKRGKVTNWQSDWKDEAASLVNTVILWRRIENVLVAGRFHWYWTETKFGLWRLVFRPDGEKKAYVRLAPDYDALDVANKVRLSQRGKFECNFYTCASDVNLLRLNVSDAFKGTTDARSCQMFTAVVLLVTCLIITLSSFTDWHHLNWQ